MKGYKPVDEEADRFVRRIIRWGPKYAPGAPPFSRDVVRLYLKTFKVNHPDIEFRIYQEFGRRGAFAKKKKAEAKKRRERAKAQKERQFRLPFD